jgi:tetratricopeptide (TPR) repeat protein
LERADAVLSEAVARGAEVGEPGAAADGAVALTFLRAHTDPYASHAQARSELEGAIRVFEQIGDASGLARALTVAGVLRLWKGEAEQAILELERAWGHARDTGDRAQEAQCLHFMLAATLHGPMPVAAAIEKVEDIRRRAGSARRPLVTILRVRAQLEAMQGHFDSARRLVAEAMTVADELGLDIAVAAGVLRGSGEIELLAGDHRAAEHALRAACDTLESRKDWGHFASVAPFLADALVAQGRGEEAVRYVELVAEVSMADDTEAQLGLLRARASLAAERGDLDAAEGFARQVVDLAHQTDYLNQQGNALTGLADVHERAGRHEQAAVFVQQALGRYERKGNLVMIERLRQRAAEPGRPG